ncbi:unnamed protein product [Camellia sinensis]
MTRRRSYCSHNGHNSRTCPNRGVKLFGVRLTDGSIRKSASMGNLTHYTGSSSGNLQNGLAGKNHDSPGDTPDHGGAAGDGYALEDFVPGSSSSRERKKDAPEFNTPQMKEEASSSSKCQSCLSSSMGNSEILRIMSLPNFMMTPNSINLDSTTMPLLDTIETDHHNKSSTQTPLQHSFTHLPFLPESHDSVLGLSESNFLDVSASTRQAVELENVSQINFGSPFLELDGTGRNDGRADSFFDELPADMFDYL